MRSPTASARPTEPAAARPRWCRGALALLLTAMASGCVVSTVPAPTRAPSLRGGVTFIGPRCAEVRSCLVGQVIAAETAAPLSRVAVFLQREDVGAKPILTLTDDQGVFTVVDAPLGRYRLAVYKDARKLEARGLKLGDPGTTLVPVRLPPG
ncbi:MAG: hypothetical protein U0168_24370 [Nannocystaceae bacterium]